jgi:hypothetical protein
MQTMASAGASATLTPTEALEIQEIMGVSSGLAVRGGRREACVGR